MERILMLFAMALALLVTTAASAQTIKVNANVPFDFIVNGATMPAGEYSVESLDSYGKVLVIGNLTSGAKSLVVATSCIALESADQTKLIFRRYANSYFLRQIWVAGNDAGHEIPPTARERELAKDLSMKEVALMAAKR
jgi:hypothetical protein